VDTSSGTTYGPITQSNFDHTVGAGAAQSTHFSQGYDITYGSNFTDESIESTLLTFASPADAAGFEPTAIDNVDAQSPSRSTLSSIPGSVLLTGTKADSDGFYEIDVVAVKGSTLMVVEYANDATPAGVPDVLSSSAAEQYALLPPGPATSSGVPNASPA
jgi:hypothetical protein